MEEFTQGSRILTEILGFISDEDLRSCLAVVFETDEGLLEKLGAQWTALQSGSKVGEGRPAKRARLEVGEAELQEGGMEEDEASFDSQTVIDPTLRTVRNHYPDPETASVKSLVDDQDSTSLGPFDDVDSETEILEGSRDDVDAEDEDCECNDESESESGSQEDPSHEQDSAIVVSPRLQLKRTADKMDEVDVPKTFSLSEPELRTLKRYHQSLLVRCVNCGIQYDKVDDKEKSCRYHPGISEFDEDGWEDHPQPVEVVDTDIMRLTMPSVFLWNCCSSQEDGASDHSSVVSDPDWTMVAMRRGRDVM